jgi:hypothetical protein
LTRNPQELLALALRRVREGTLTCEHPARLFAGPGRQSSCSLCSESIGSADIEYEVDVAKSASAPEPLYFHRSCYYAWMQACTPGG